MRMRCNARAWGMVGAVLALWCASALAVEVKLTVPNDAAVERKGGVVTSGVPFAKGAVTDLTKLVVKAGGAAVPAQFQELAKWDDGSLRWVLVDTQVDAPAGGSAELTVSDAGGNAAPAAPVKVTDGADALTVSTGPLEFTVDKKAFNLFKSIKVDGKELAGPGGKGLVLYKADKSEAVAAAPDEVKVEQAGPVRATILLKGKFSGIPNDQMQYTVRVSAYAGRKHLKIHAWLRNEGAHGWTWEANKEKVAREFFTFDGMAIDLGLALGDGVSAECEGVKGIGKFRVYQTCLNATKYTEPAYSWDQFEYTIKSGDQELKKDKRTDGVVALKGPNGKCTAAVRDFWQNYEKAIELDGNSLKVWLWPQEGLWPRNFFDHSAPGYATADIDPLRVKDGYNMPGAIHKGHEIILDFSGADAKASSAELNKPLFAFATPAYYGETEAAPGLFAPPDVRTGNKRCDKRIDGLIQMTKNVADPAGDSSIWVARKGRVERGNYFDYGYSLGWLEFGDLGVPGRGYSSLQHDWPWVTLSSALRFTDVNFLRLGEEMMRHRIDIDNQWSDRELEQYRGFQRPAGGYAHFHCERFSRGQPNVLTTWLPGLVLFHMLTGDAKTREAIDRCAPRIEPAWNAIFASDDYGTKQIPGNMYAVCTTIFNYIALYDLTADKAWLDKAVAMYTKCVTAKAKHFGPFLHGENQIASQDYIEDDKKYCYVIHILCELHHLTKNESLLELLQGGCDNEWPENFYDAPVYLAGLNAYVGSVTGQQQYYDNAAKFFMQGFPRSASPPVYQANNSQWAFTVPLLLRGANIFQWGLWKKPKEAAPNP
ncbi:MAG: hypothetical protein L6R28_00395 [Planctomycetes bacterium]|nr:hypothetical protein [Planctomycetota bacterium]